MWFQLKSFCSKNMALFAYLEDPGQPLFTASIPTVKYVEKENIRSQLSASIVHQLADIALNERLTRTYVVSYIST